MKKVILPVALIISALYLAAQTVPNCSLDEYVLLTNHPADINDFEAADLISGKKNKITVISDQGYFLSYANQRDMFSLPKMNASRQKKEITLYMSAEGGGKRIWRTTGAIYFDPQIRHNRHFYYVCMIAFLIVFSVSLPIINSCGYEKSYTYLSYRWYRKEDRPLILKTTMIASACFGLILYVIYISILKGQLETGRSVRLEWREPAILIAGTVLSGLLYLGLLTVIYVIKRFNRSFKKIAIS